jgi:hypothetical protein
VLSFWGRFCSLDFGDGSFGDHSESCLGTVLLGTMEATPVFVMIFVDVFYK